MNFSARFNRTRRLSDIARAQSAPSLRELAVEKSEITLVANQFAIEAEIGRGGEGVCYLAHEVHADRAVALKRRHCNSIDHLNEAIAEASMLARVSGTMSPLFPRFYHSHVEKTEDDGFVMYELYIAMEHIVGGELFRVLRHSQMQNKLPIERWCRELARAVELLHSLGYAHRDIKPENLLVRNDNTYTLVLCDFGSCALIGGRRVENTGSTFYMAPEITDVGASAMVEATRSIDWWAAGVVMLEIASRGTLFTDRKVSPGAEAKRRCLGANASVLDSISWDTFVAQRYINTLPPPFAATLGALIGSLLRLEPRGRLTTNRPLHVTVCSTRSDSSSPPPCNGLKSASGSPTRPAVRRLSSLNGSVLSA
jgi:serine/threonine protein kinase